MMNGKSSNNWVPAIIDRSAEARFLQMCENSQKSDHSPVSLRYNNKVMGDHRNLRNLSTGPNHSVAKKHGLLH